MKIVSGSKGQIPYIAGTGGLANGSVAVVSSTTAIKATAGITDATILGIALDAYDATEVAQIGLIGEGTVILAKFTNAGTKKTFADADLGKVYDISDDVTINPDDTTGGSFMLIGYDNDNLEAMFVVPQAKRYL